MNVRSSRALCAGMLGMVLLLSVRAQAGEKIIVHFQLKGALAEAPSSPTLLMLGDSKQLTTRTLLERLRAARQDSDVEAVFVTFDSVQMGLAQIQDLRRAMGELKAAGKPVYIHLDSCYSTALYWLACQASHLAVVPTGDIFVTGLYGEQLYLKDFMEKLYLDADVIHIGDYKSAGEILTRREPSAPAAQMMEWLFDSLYEQMVDQIAESRAMEASAVRDAIDEGPYSAEQAEQRGLIDELAYRKEFVDAIKSRHGEVRFEKDYQKGGKLELDMDNPFAFMQEIFERMSKGPDLGAGRPAVALVYVQGMIIPGEGDLNPLGGVNHGASSSLRKALYEAAYDEDIKAVVLRVDSPGGSAVASEIIWHATQEVARRKPFVVSMGNVAASGGYFVSCGADTIFAEPGTITGSIGVVGLKLVTKGFWDWIGWNWHPVQRGKNADIMSTEEPWSPAQRKKIRTWMEEVYETFKSRVQAGRRDQLAKPLEEIAGGRVYTGVQALELGLVDRLGGLQDALQYAAQRTGMAEDAEVKILPKPKNIFDLLMEGFAVTGGGQAVRLPLPDALQRALPVIEKLDPQRGAAIQRVLQQLELLQSEPVLMVMPQEIIIR